MSPDTGDGVIQVGDLSGAGVDLETKTEPAASAIVSPGAGDGVRDVGDLPKTNPEPALNPMGLWIEWLFTSDFRESGVKRTQNYLEQQWTLKVSKLPASTRRLGSTSTGTTRHPIRGRDVRLTANRMRNVVVGRSHRKPPFQYLLKGRILRRFLNRLQIKTN
jgi:hypothetical protein